MSGSGEVHLPVQDRHPDPAARFAELARSLSGEATVKATLQRIVDLAVETIDGCDGAGVLLITKGKIVGGSWSSELVRGVEEMEYLVGEGPCVDAILQAPAFESPDLRDQADHWPTFVAGALEAGVQSMLAFRLFVAGDTLGALDLYGFEPDSFDETTRALGVVFAAHAALALAGAQTHEHDVAAAAGLREALVTRDLIGQAKGILMATHQIDAEAAFDLLRVTSQHLNVKLRDIADRVVTSGQLPRT